MNPGILDLPRRRYRTSEFGGGRVPSKRIERATSNASGTFLWHETRSALSSKVNGTPFDCSVAVSTFNSSGEMKERFTMQSKPLSGGRIHFTKSMYAFGEFGL